MKVENGMARTDEADLTTSRRFVWTLLASMLCKEVIKKRKMGW